MRGITEFEPKNPIVWDDEKELHGINWEEDDGLVQEWEDGDTPETNIDGLTEYGYGFWFRYLTTRPNRLYDPKPDWMALARFTSNTDHKDLANVADRTLAIWVGKGFYHFTTYNLRGPVVNVI